MLSMFNVTFGSPGPHQSPRAIANFFRIILSKVDGGQGSLENTGWDLKPELGLTPHSPFYR